MEHANASLRINDTLSEVYTHGLERRTGTTNISEITFTLPSTIIEERKNFWDKFFTKYITASDETSYSTNKLNRSRYKVQQHYEKKSAETCPELRIPMRKPMTFVQYWVNTGTLPRDDITANSTSLVPSLNKQDPLSPTNSIKIERKPARRTLLKICDSSSSSSVNTTDTSLPHDILANRKSLGVGPLQNKQDLLSEKSYINIAKTPARRSWIASDSSSSSSVNNTDTFLPHDILASGRSLVVGPSLSKQDLLNQKPCTKVARKPVRRNLTKISDNSSSSSVNNTNTFLPHDILASGRSLLVGPSLYKQDFLNQKPCTKVPRKPVRRNWTKISDNSSSSSVNTVAYILSNAHTTKKAEATAIVEGSKLKENMGSQLTTPEAEPCLALEPGKDNAKTSNDALQDNDSNSTDIPLQKETEITVTDVVPESNPPITSIAEDNIVHHTILTPDSNSPDVPAPSASQNITLMQSIEQALKCVTNNNIMTPSQSERDSMERDAPAQALIHEEVSILDSHSSLSGTDSSKIHRKKLYSGRDSPVDLVNIRSSMASKLSQTTQNLHPALDPVTSAIRKALLKKRKLKVNKRKQKWSLLIAKASMNNTVAGSATGLNGSVNGMVGKIKKTKTKAKTPAKKRAKTDSHFNRVKMCTPKRTPIRRKMVAHNIQPVVRLRRLSDKIVKKYMQQSPMSNLKMNPVVQLQRLSDSFIQKQTLCKKDKKSNQKNIERARKSQELFTPKRASSTNDVKKKSSRSLIPLDAQYIDSDVISNSSSTILFANCKNNNSKHQSDSSVMDNSSQDLLYKVDNLIPNGKSMENVITNDMLSTPKNDLFDKLKNHNNSKVRTVETSSSTKREKLRRSGKFEVIKYRDVRTPVLVLDRLLDNDLSSCISSPSSKREQHTHTDNVQRNSSSQETPVRPQSARSNLRLRAKVETTPIIQKSPEQFFFQTILEPEICSDYSSNSKDSSTARQKRQSLRTHSISRNKRSRGVLITLSSDEDDLESILPKLPRKKVRSHLDDTKQSRKSLNLNGTRLAHTMVIQSDDHDSEAEKKSKKKATQSKRRMTQTSVVSVADSTTVEKGEKSMQRSIDGSPKKVTKNGGRRSKRLTNYEMEKSCSGDTVKKNSRVSCTEPDSNHVTSTSIEEKLSTGKFLRSDSIRNRSAKNR